MGIVLIPHGSGMMRMACAASHDLAAVAAWRIGIRDQEVSTLAGGATPRLAWTSPHCGAGFMPADGVSPGARGPAGAGFGRDKPGPTDPARPGIERRSLAPGHGNPRRATPRLAWTSGTQRGRLHADRRSIAERPGAGWRRLWPG